jgi:hypothetical protein
MKSREVKSQDVYWLRELGAGDLLGEARDATVDEVLIIRDEDGDVEGFAVTFNEFPRAFFPVDQELAYIEYCSGQVRLYPNPKNTGGIMRFFPSAGIEIF